MVERSSRQTAGGKCASNLARPRDPRTSPRSPLYPEHVAHAFASPTFTTARLQVALPFLSTSGMPTAAVWGVWRRRLGGIDAVGCRGCARWVRAGSAGCLRLRASRADVVGMLRFGCPPRRVSPRLCCFAFGQPGSAFRVGSICVLPDVGMLGSGGPGSTFPGARPPRERAEGAPCVATPLLRDVRACQYSGVRAFRTRVHL